MLAGYLLGFDQIPKQKAEFTDPIDVRFDVPPEEAIDYFRRKRVVMAKEFYRLDTEAKDAAFTVSGVYKKHILEAMKEEIAQALETGKPPSAVVKGLKEILEGAGHKELGDYHLETIVRTNMQRAYGVGRRRGLEATMDLLPYWEYNAVMDDRTRPTHAALNGLVMPATSPFWDSHFPPWDFSCRCSVTATDEMPAGYKKTNPSGDYELSYGDDDLPAYATDGISTFDLSAGKFRGVPKQTSLKDAIEEGLDDAEAASERVPKAVLKKEDEIRYKQVEHAAVFDDSGNVVLAKEGTKKYVEFSDAESALMRDRIVTHNHPVHPKLKKSDPRYKGMSFSLEDVKQAAYNQVAQMRVVTPAYRHSMLPGKDGWDSKFFDAKIEPTFRKIFSEVTRKFFDARSAGKMSFEEATTQVWHETWKRTAKELRLIYKRSEN